MIKLPLYSDPLYTFSTSLDGVDYRFKLDYSQRADRWYLGIFDAEGSPIRQGIKLSPNVSMLRLCKSDARCPQAGLFVFDLKTLEAGESPGLFDLERRVTLWYGGTT